MLEREVFVGDRYTLSVRGRNIVVTGIFGDRGVLDEFDGARYFRRHLQKGREGTWIIMGSERMRAEEVNWRNFKGRFSLEQMIEGTENYLRFARIDEGLKIQERFWSILTYRYNAPPLKVRF